MNHVLDHVYILIFARNLKNTVRANTGKSTWGGAQGDGVSIQSPTWSTLTVLADMEGSLTFASPVFS